MATSSSLRTAVALAAAPLLAGSGTPVPKSSWAQRLDGDERSLVGYAGHVPDSTKPRITAFFPRESYAPGDVAQLEVTDHAWRVSIQVLRAGTVPRANANDVMSGSPVTPLRQIGAVAGKRAVSVRLGTRWPSGLYFAQLTSGARAGYATFVLRPRRLGEHPVAIVLPTQTWQAYNFRDDNGDGVPDTWYAAGNTARLSRPFLNRGVPPHYKFYDANFLRWAYSTHHEADYISDAELNAASGAQLRRAYQLLIFEGHHEYVTEHEYDAVEKYRDLGGNLMFLSANNFFWKITIDGSVMTRVARWRDIGRPEAALIGVQYYNYDFGQHRGQWVVHRAAARLPWLLNETGLRVGMPFGNGGIEADDVSSASPRNVIVVAAIRNLFDDGRDADMAYYETPAGAKVFAAGAFTLAGSVGQGHVRELVSNLWERLARD